MKLTKQNYAEIISGLSQEDKVSFYEFLSHNLTVSCRVMWSNEAISKDEIIDSMKWINEILHRVTAKIRVERLKQHEWKEEDVIKMIFGCVNQCPQINSEVTWALRKSFETLLKAQSQK